MTDYNHHKGSANRESKSYLKYNGLINQGSTCYLNSVLQVLFMTKEFREAVERYYCDSNTLDIHLKDLFKELETNTGTTDKLTKVLGISRGDVQSDAAECFENILNKVTNLEASQLFKGIQTTINKCSKCSTETSTEDPFWSLPLELEDSYDDYYLVDGINNYFKESDLKEPNQLYCEHCSAKSDATIKVEMKHHPEVLTLLLKRFKFNYHYEINVKVRRLVQIPEYLEIPPNGDKGQIYELYAYVEHMGELRNGHYTVTIKAQNDHIWYTFDDRYVHSRYYQPFTSNKSEKNSGVYLLFYKKISKESKEGQESKESAESANQQKQQGDASGKLNESPPTGLSKEDSVISKSDTIEQNRQAERQKQEKAVAEPEGCGGREKERITLGKNQRGNNEMDKQEQDQDLFDSKCENRNLFPDTIYHRMQKSEVLGFQKNTSKPAPEVKRLKMTDRNSTNECEMTQRAGSNDQSKINGTEVDVNRYPTSGIDQNQKKPVEISESDVKKKTVRAAVFNKPAVCNKPSQKRENDFQYVEICGKFYENCGEIITGKKENYLILKGKCLASGEDFNQQNACHNPECKINQLSHHIHIHADVLDEPCREASKLNTKAANLQTAGTSEDHHCRNEWSQKTGQLSQPKQGNDPECAVIQNQMTGNIQNSTANKTLEKGDANMQYSHLTIHSSYDITSSSFQTCSGTVAPYQQSLETKGNGIAFLSSDFKNLTLDDSQSKDDSLEGPLKRGNGTGNQQFTVSNVEKNANPQSDMQIQVETEEQYEGSKRTCPGLLSGFYN